MAKQAKSTTEVPVIDLTENMDVHAKAYVQLSFDQAIKAFQAKEIKETGENITYSEAMRRLIMYGLESSRGFGGVKYVGKIGDNE